MTEFIDYVQNISMRFYFVCRCRILCILVYIVELSDVLETQPHRVYIEVQLLNLAWPTLFMSIKADATVVGL